MPGMTPDRRRADLAQIHIAKEQLGLDDETYRDMLFTIGRVRSSADLDYAGRRKVLEHMKSRGYRPGRGRGSRYADDPLSRKILALWLEMRDQGVIENASNAALRAFLKRQTGVERLEWLNNKQADVVIESLKSWLEREAPGSVIESR